MSTMILSREIMLVCDLRPCCSMSLGNWLSQIQGSSLVLD